MGEKIKFNDGSIFNVETGEYENENTNIYESEKLEFADGAIFDVETGEFEREQTITPIHHINNSYQWENTSPQYSDVSSYSVNQNNVGVKNNSSAFVVLSFIISFICVFCFFNFYLGYTGSPAGNYVLDSLTNEGKTETAEEYTRIAKIWKKMGEWEGSDLSLGKLALNKNGQGKMTIKGDGRDITWNDESIILTEGAHTYPYKLEDNKLIIIVDDIKIVFVQKKNRIWILIGVLFALTYLIIKNHNKGNKFLRNLLIATTVVIIGFAIVNPKTQTKNQVTTNEKKNNSNTVISPKPQITTLQAEPGETFTVPKYVHIDLNVHEEKDLESRTLFTVSKDSIVYLSDKHKDGIIVKIKFDDNHIGWLNSTYLRDFKITSVQVGNYNSDKDTWVVRPGNKLNALNMNQLGIKFDVETKINNDKDTTYYVRVINPENKYFQGKNTPSGFTGWFAGPTKTGSFQAIIKDIPNNYYKNHLGTWRIEIWYHDPKNTNEQNFTCIASTEFILY